MAWDAVMGIGFGVLRLAPDAFWEMTLKELSAAMRVVLPEEAGRVGSAQLHELMKRFPD